MKTWRTAKVDASCKHNFFKLTSQWCDRFLFFQPHFDSAHQNKKRLKSVSSLRKYIFRYSFWSLIKGQLSSPLFMLLCCLMYVFFPFRSTHFFFLYFWRIMLSCLRWWRRHECIYSAIWILRYSSKRRRNYNISLYLWLSTNSFKATIRFEYQYKITGERRIMEFQTSVKNPIFSLFLAADLTYGEVSDNCCVTNG